MVQLAARPTCLSGEIGKRARFKPVWLSGLVGSSPTLGMKYTLRNRVLVNSGVS